MVIVFRQFWVTNHLS